jgi:hypothetical protein
MSFCFSKGFFGTLTGCTVAVTMVFDMRIGDKRIQTMSTANGFHGFSAPFSGEALLKSTQKAETMRLERSISGIRYGIR